MKKLWPYIATLILFLCISGMYMYPELQGQKIGAVDNVNAISAMGESIRYTAETGKQSWWNGAMYSGMPNYQIGGAEYQSMQWLSPLLKVLRAGYHSPIMLMLLYLVCFYALMLSMKIGRWLSAVGAVAMALSSYFILIIGASHVTKATTIALMTLALAGFYLIFHNHRKTGICLCMIGTAAGFSPHPQMTYYICFLFAAFGIAELWIACKSRAWRTFAVNSALALLALGIGVGTSMANTFANLEYVRETIRGGTSELSATENSLPTGGSQGGASSGLDYQYAMEYSYGIDETMTLLVPDYKGGSSAAGTYWGEQPDTEGPVYVGAVVLFLFVLSLLVVRGPYKYALAAVAALSVILSWGYHFETFNRLVFDWFPWYNKFRAVASVLIIAEIAIPLLAMMGLRDITDAMRTDTLDKTKLRRKIFIAAGITAGISILGYLSATMHDTFCTTTEAITAASADSYLGELINLRKQMLSHDVGRTLCLVLAGMAVLMAFVYRKIRQQWMLALVGAIILFDLWSVDRRYVNDTTFQPQADYDAFFDVQPWEQLILENDTSQSFRVVNISDPQMGGARTSYRLKNVSGYSAARLRRYDDVLREHLSKQHMPVFNMLNTKYMIVKNPETGEPLVTLNEDAMGNAWYVDSIAVVGSPREESDALMTADLRSTAIVGKDFAQYVKSHNAMADTTAIVTMTKYEPDCVTYEAESQTAGIIVFSEIYYPYGWKAYVDDKPTDHFRVNYILRAMNIEAGKHTIRFEFRPDSVAKGDTLSMIFVILMYLTMAGCIVLGTIQMRRK